MKKLIAIIGTAFIAFVTVAVIKKPKSVYEGETDEQNPMEGKRVILVENEDDAENADGVRGHLEAVETKQICRCFYDRVIKRVFDIVLSFFGLVIFGPIFLVLAIAVFIDDPGPVFFTQKRVGMNKKYFKLHKFRTMKMSTPHDKPTHMLENPDQYITRVGKFMRAHSMDELPQIWDIFIGNMSIVGPRPALWNQDLLTAEREKYEANYIKPGLTGWAQINGRDELEIPIKAKLDGEYANAMKTKRGFVMDMKCFLGSVGVLKGDKSVVEGGTGAMEKE